MKVELHFTLNYNPESIPAKEEDKEIWLRNHLEELTDLLMLHVRQEDSNAVFEVKVNGRD